MRYEVKKPSIKEEKISNVESRFIIEPYEKGFGITIGNSLRRVLLSSLSSFVPFAIQLQIKTKIQSKKKTKDQDVEIIVAKHEFDALPGIKEAVYEVILNVRKLVINIDKNIFNSEDEIIQFSIKDASGEIKAKDLELPVGVKIFNPNLVLFTFNPNEEVVSATLLIYVKEGRGYVTSIENRDRQPIEKRLDVHAITIDSNFSPILNVGYEIKSLLGFQTPHEKLILTILTNGSITPKFALENASYILEHQFKLFGNSNLDSFIFKEKNARNTRIRPVFLEELGLDKKTLTALKNAKIRDFYDLASKTNEELLNIKHIGEKGIVKVLEAIKNRKSILDENTKVIDEEKKDSNSIDNENNVE